MRQVFLLGQISSKKEYFYAFSKILDIFKLCPSKNIWSQCILMDFKIISYLSFKWIHMQFIKVNVKVKYKKKTELGQNEKYVCSYNYFSNVTFFHNSFSWKKEEYLSISFLQDLTFSRDFLTAWQFQNYFKLTSLT